MPASGTTLGPYRILRKLGEGGMGEVYQAHDARLNRTVAIKILSPEIATPDRLHRFEQEARAASALNHPNILTIHDVGRDGDTAYFAMEWVDGRTLRELMNAERLPLRRVIEIAQQIAEGLAKAHAAGIVHRDLKPENVMVTADGYVKIVDFGIAKLADEAASNADAKTRTMATVAGMVLGTLGYMSPEQASGRPVDYRSDQFALGLLVYELATGTRPFERATTAQSLAATIEDDPTPVEVLNPAIPPHLATVVARCLDKDPANRYESTRDLARDLKSMLDAGSRQTAPSAPPVRKSGARVLTIAALALLAAAAGAAGWMMTRGRGPARDARRPLVAVRPFRSLSPDPAQGYFAAGMTEEIRGQLSQISSLRLLSRNALDAAAGSDTTRAVRELGVTQLVDGSVRVEGQRVRVTAELIDAATQQTLWSDRYDREGAGMLDVQSEVAVQIARALRANLTPDEQQRLEKRPTANPDAYAIYLQSQMLPSSDRAKNLAAIEMLRKAVALDPQFAAAQARLAYRLVFMGYYDDPSYIDKGIAEAETALRMNPSVSAAHFTMATAYGMKGMDAQARVSFLRALELNPNDTAAMANLSVLEAAYGRLGESLSWARRMFALSGKEGNAFHHVAVPLLVLRDDDATRRWLLEGERRFPDFYRIQINLAFMDVFGGRPRDASSRVARLVARLPNDEEARFTRADVAFLTGSEDLAPALEALAQSSESNTMMVPETVRLRLAYVAGQRGDAARASALLDDAERSARGRIDRGDRTPALRVEMAAAAALRHDHPAGIQWLERAYDAGYREYGLLELDPILGTIQPAAKFRQIVDRMRQDVEAQRAHARERGLLDLDGLLAPAK